MSTTGNNVLRVDLRWQALKRMDSSYKVFLHLIDPATGEVAGQIDTMPRDWGYPTTWWEKDEMVSDSLQLSLVDIPQGHYELFVGLYDAATGERLPITRRQAGSNHDDSFHLATIQR